MSIEACCHPFVEREEFALGSGKLEVETIAAQDNSKSRVGALLATDVRYWVTSDKNFTSVFYRLAEAPSAFDSPWESSIRRTTR